MKNVMFMTICFLLFTMSVGYSKQICSPDGRVTMTAPSNWYYKVCPKTEGAFGVFGAAPYNDIDTGVVLYQGLYALPWENFSQMTVLEKSLWKEQLIEIFKNGMCAQGYSVYVQNASIASDAIFIVFLLEKTGLKFKTVLVGMVSKSRAYMLLCMGTPTTFLDTVKNAKTIKLDGFPIEIWMSL